MVWLSGTVQSLQNASYISVSVDLKNVSTGDVHARSTKKTCMHISVCTYVLLMGITMANDDKTTKHDF